MSQILKLKRGSLERLSLITGSLQKGEVIFASASIGIPSSNGSSIMFATTESGSVQATNRIMKTTGSVAPDLSNPVYGGLIDGIPYYTSGSSTLYLLNSNGNEAINLEGNIQPFSASVYNRLEAIEQFSSSLDSTFATDIELSAVSQSISASQTLISESISASLAGALGNIETYFPDGVISSSQQVIDIINANFVGITQSIDNVFATDYEVYVTTSVADGGEW